MFWSLADICLLKIVHNCNFKRSSSSNFKSLKTEQINSHTVCIITKTDSTFSRQQGNYVINSQYTYKFLCEMPICLHQAHTDRHVLQLFFCDHCERNLPCTTKTDDVHFCSAWFHQLECSAHWRAGGGWKGPNRKSLKRRRHRVQSHLQNRCIFRRLQNAAKESASLIVCSRAFQSLGAELEKA